MYLSRDGTHRVSFSNVIMRGYWLCMALPGRVSLDTDENLTRNIRKSSSIIAAINATKSHRHSVHSKCSAAWACATLRSGDSPNNRDMGRQVGVAMPVSHSSSSYTTAVLGLGWISLNTLRPRQNGRRFADDVFKCIFVNENVWISLEISLNYVPNVPINNIPALVQILAWRRSGDKPLSEPMLVSLLTHICVTRPQWVNNQVYITNGNPTW